MADYKTSRNLNILAGGCFLFAGILQGISSSILGAIAYGILGIFFFIQAYSCNYKLKNENNNKSKIKQHKQR